MLFNFPRQGQFPMRACTAAYNQIDIKNASQSSRKWSGVVTVARRGAASSANGPASARSLRLSLKQLAVGTQAGSHPVPDVRSSELAW